MSIKYQTSAGCGHTKQPLPVRDDGTSAQSSLIAELCQSHTEAEADDQEGKRSTEHHSKQLLWRRLSEMSQMRAKQSVW